MAITLGQIASPIQPETSVRTTADTPNPSMPPTRARSGPRTFASQAHMAASDVASHDCPVAQDSTVMTTRAMLTFAAA